MLTRTLGPALAMAALVTIGCGHPATKEECTRILKKSAELKLKEQGKHPEVIEQRTEQLLDAKGEKLIEECVGRRITDSAVKCVEKATSATEVDKCLY